MRIIQGAEDPGDLRARRQTARRARAGFGGGGGGGSGFRFPASLASVRAAAVLEGGRAVAQEPSREVPGAGRDARVVALLEPAVATAGRAAVYVEFEVTGLEPRSPRSFMAIQFGVTALDIPTAEELDVTPGTYVFDAQVRDGRLDGKRGPPRPRWKERTAYTPRRRGPPSTAYMTQVRDDCLKRVARIAFELITRAA